MRGIAVLTVVVYHFWPAALPGGFVGVDVFFAISGYLITALLLREIEHSGRVSLPRFWARRARRLLPAALLTLAVCAAATLAFVPVALWQPFFADLQASTAYVQNWHLAGTAVDYFAAGDEPSPVRHYWSLSAEEQFYVVWPVLLAAAVMLTARRAPAPRRAVGFAIVAPTLLSLAYSISRTAADPDAAYFLTATRAWEFGLGGILALLPQQERSPAGLRSALAWIGVAAIALAAVIYNDATAFPGYAALLPVLGAVAVIRAGAPSGRWSPMWLFRLRPLQFAGDVSYSLYLWHWPLLILAPFVVGGSLTTPRKVVILMLTVLFAWLSKVLVEDPIRRGRLLVRRRPRWTFASALVATGAVLLLTATGSARVDRQVAADERASRTVLEASPDCFGAAARDPERPCVNPELELAVVPTPLQARTQPNADCEFLGRSKFLCEFGTPRRQATLTAVLLGDSHAGHWRGAVEPLARARKWRGLAMILTGCPFSTATKALPRPRRSACAAWNRKALRWFRAHPEATTVIQSQVAGGKPVITERRDKFAAAVDGYVAAWRELPPTVEQIVVLRDTPGARGTTGACVERAMRRKQPAGPACAMARRESVEADPLAAAARKVGAPRVHLVDLTDFFCDRRKCYPVVGGALVYKDPGHLTATFARSLAPYLQRSVDAAMPPAG